jgi:hypothetical protein
MVSNELENLIRQGVVTYRGGKRGYRLKAPKQKEIEIPAEDFLILTKKYPMKIKFKAPFRRGF